MFVTYKAWKYLIVALLFVISLGFLIPESKTIPVQGATSRDWNKNTFWFEPWGSSGVHKGIDIFAKNNTPVIASTNLFVLYKGSISKGGNIVLALGPKWRLHYFAHLSSIDSSTGRFLKTGDPFAYVGDTGNAKGKQPHLHYSIVSLLPMVWQIDSSTQGYKKMFYLDPIEYLK